MFAEEEEVKWEGEEVKEEEARCVVEVEAWEEPHSLSKPDKTAEEEEAPTLEVGLSSLVLLVVAIHGAAKAEEAPLQ